MKFSLETFAALRLISPGVEKVAYPEKGLLAVCYLLTQPHVEYPRASLARFLWDDHG
ncbi:hypothetical protein [Rhizobium sp. LjRoot258]|uniref:hypothetical protein n=1 Tax=Rhizobium sp. LjRoot258 TaxID=3342299 RepID=UPI003ECEFEF7